MSEKPMVLMTNKIPDEWIGDKLDDYHIVFGKQDYRGIDQKLAPYLNQASGIFCLLDDPITAEVIQKAINLKVISTMAVGVDNIDIPTCTLMGIAVGHTPGVLTDGTADLTLALILAVCRQVIQSSQDARDGRWASWNPVGWLGIDLKGATVGIVGMGKIGSAVTSRLMAFGSKLIFCNRSPRPDQEKMGAIQVSLDELLRVSDIVCLHVPLTSETKNLIDKAAFQKMKETAVLINAARGAVVDQKALQHALESGQIRAAGLDVTNPEPLPPDHPLYQLDNCLITPHIGSATYNTRKTMAEIAIDNLRAGIEGRELLHCANPDIYS